MSREKDEKPRHPYEVACMEALQLFLEVLGSYDLAVENSRWEKTIAAIKALRESRAIMGQVREPSLIPFWFLIFGPPECLRKLIEIELLPLQGLLCPAISLRHAEHVQVLLNAGASPNERDKDGRSAFQLAMSNQDLGEELSRQCPEIDLRREFLGRRTSRSSSEIALLLISTNKLFISEIDRYRSLAADMPEVLSALDQWKIQRKKEIQRKREGWGGLF